MPLCAGVAYSASVTANSLVQCCPGQLGDCNQTSRSSWFMYGVAYETMTFGQSQQRCAEVLHGLSASTRDLVWCDGVLQG